MHNWNQGKDLIRLLKAASDEIELFKRDRRVRMNNVDAADKISPEDLLREVLNTVGKKENLVSLFDVLSRSLCSPRAGMQIQ